MNENKLTWDNLPPTCPACGAEPYSSATSPISRRYDCGQWLILLDGHWEHGEMEDCNAAFGVAIQLRAERDAALARAQALERALDTSQMVIRTEGNVITHRSECAICSQKYNNDWNDSDCPRLRKLYDAESYARGLWQESLTMLAAAAEGEQP